MAAITPFLVPRFGANVFLPASATIFIYKIIQKVGQIAIQSLGWRKKDVEVVAVLGGMLLGGYIVEKLLPSLFVANPILGALATIINVGVGIYALSQTQDKPSSDTLSPSFATNLTEEARDHTRLHGREDVLEKIERSLARPEGMRSAILIGEPGCQLDLIAKECARRIVASELSQGSSLRNKEIYFLNASTLVSMRYAEIRKGLDALAKNSNAILFIDQLDLLAETANHWPRQLLSPYITSGKITVVGITSPGKRSAVQGLPFTPSMTFISVELFNAESCFLTMQEKNRKGQFTNNYPQITVTDEALALATLFAYHHVTHGFVVQDAAALLSDVIYKLRNSGEMRLTGDVFLDSWREIYRQDPIKISIASLSTDAKEFLSRQGVRIDELMPEVIALNKQKGQARLSQADMPRFLRDMVEEAREGKYPPCIGREEEIGAVMRSLRQSTGGSLVLLGEPGIGKTAIFEAIAMKIAREDPSVPFLKGKTLYWVDITALSSTGGFVGEIEFAVDALLQFARQRGSDAIFVIDELHQTRGPGAHSKSDVDVLELLKNGVARGEIVIFGSSNGCKWNPIAIRDPAIERRFRPIRVGPPTPQDCMRMLMHTNQSGFYTRGYDPARVEVTEEAVRAAIDLTEKYMQTKFLPDKATALIAQTVALCQEEEERRPEAGRPAGKKRITPREVAGCLYDAVKHTLADQTTSREDFVSRVS